MVKHKGGHGGRHGGRQGSGGDPRQRRRKAGRGGDSGRVWLYGSHAVLAALANPARRPYRLLVTEEAERRLDRPLEAVLADCPGAPGLRRCERAEIAAQLPEGAVHQGLALECAPLESLAFDDILDQAVAATIEKPCVILALDQVTDPHNVGAILRSAAAFGAAAVVAPRSHAAPETGALAKAASGALEKLPYIALSNLARALEQAADAGFQRFGLDAEADTALSDLPREARQILVLGAEGSGLRRLTREHCDRLVRLPTSSGFGSLNVSNAAAVALYERLSRSQN